VSRTTDDDMKRLRRYLDSILDQFRFERVLLFGSRARGVSGEASDFDLAFFIRDYSYWRAHDLGVHLLLASRGFGLDIEPHIYPVEALTDDSHLFVQQEILPHAVVLYPESAAA